MVASKISYFDDLSSWGHGILGIVLANLKPELSLGILLLFTVYQMKEVEPLDSKLGDFAELGTGWMIGRVIKGGGKK